MSEFKLENRYTVIKNNILKPHQQKIINAMCDVIDEHLVSNSGGTCRPAGVFIERDWPEYDIVVKMLAERVNAYQAKILRND